MDERLVNTEAVALGQIKDVKALAFDIHWAAQSIVTVIALRAEQLRETERVMALIEIEQDSTWGMF